MTSLERKLVAGDQFSFSSSSLPGVELDEESGLAFGNWTGWHCDDYIGSDGHNEPERLAKEELLSPTSRVQAIGRYKENILELVGDAPEYVYELSLRDLVELPRIVKNTERESPERERLQKNKKARRKPSRSESMESGGFLLKMFFPIPSSGRQRRSGSSSGSLKPGSRSSSSGSSDSGSRSSSKSGSSWGVSLKPLMKDGRKSGAVESSEGKYVEMQQHGALSIDCSRYQNGCYPFFLNQNKSRTTKILC